MNKTRPSILFYGTVGSMGISQIQNRLTPILKRLFIALRRFRNLTSDKEFSPPLKLNKVVNLFFENT